MTIDHSTAYDGMSKCRQRRALTPLERDILTRILNDIFGQLRREKSLDSLQFIEGVGAIRMDVEEIPILVSIRDAINPRPRD